jgi:IclR family KDG regulon transcriptional repressor
MSAAGRALRLLEYLSAVSEGVSTQEMATALAIPRSTLYDLIAELRSLGYVQQTAGGYEPGVAMTLLGHRISLRLGTPAAIQPTLERLAQATGETALYCVEIGGDAAVPGQVLIVEQVASPNPIRYVAPTGSPRSLTQTASGRVLLTFSGRDDADDPRLRDQLAGIRDDGYSINVADSGATSIAAPVFGTDGTAVAALAVTGPSQRMTDAAQRIWPTLRAAAESLRRQ